jgi:hypothetical protein
MADNVAISAGTGTDIATDDAGAGGHVQLFKLAYSADGSRTLVPVDADGLLVNLGTTNDVSLNAGTNAIGKLAANSGVDIGDVDVTSISAGTNVIGRVGYQPTYAAKATITVTLTSLANGSARESTVIDNTTNRYRNARIRIQTKGQASGTAYLDVYVYTALGDTTYTDAATGSDAAFTAANRFNSRYLGSVKCNANTSAVQAELQLSDVFPTCPDKWGLIFINSTGAALSATGGDHVIEYSGIY